MFERMRLGYNILIGLTIAQILLAEGLGQADLWLLMTSENLSLMIVLIAGFFPLVWITGVALAITFRHSEKPIHVLWRMIKREKNWLLRGTFLAIVIIVFARSFSGFKSSISRLNPFWADPWLVQLDVFTFGTDPWLLTHAVFGSTATLILDRIYIFWFFMLFLTMGWFCFTRNAKLQIRGLSCYLLCWSVLGGITAVTFSSVGPCFYEQFYNDGRFAPLMAKLSAVDAENPLFATRSMRYLIESLGADKFGSGISAMPSLHVTIAMLSFLAVRSYSDSKILKVFSGLFAAAILVGSVHLGWHYAWDGIFGIGAVVVFWSGSGKFVDWVEAREADTLPEPQLRPLPASS